MTAPTQPLETPVPSLLYSDAEDELRQVIRRILGDISPWAVVVDRLDADTAHDPELWHALSAAGVTGLLIPESVGGAGATAREMAVALEEIGRSTAPVPMLTSGVIATSTLVSVGSAAEPWLRRLADSESIGAVAVVGSTRCDVAVEPVFRGASVTLDGSCAITGRIAGVVGADRADFLVVPAVTSEGPVLAVVDPVPSGAVQTGCSLDMTRPLATIELTAAPATVIARGEAALAAVQRGLLAGTVLLASEQLGVADRALELACDQLRTRRQFGRLLGTYQSLRHRAADLWTQITQARAVARYAAACWADDLADTELAAHLAQAVCADVALDAAEACLQIMGGIGFTWENPTHLTLKRAVASHSLLGTPESHRDRIFELRGIEALA